MSKRTHLTEYEKQCIVRAFLQGERHEDIAKAFERAVPTIASVLHEAGVPARRGPGSVRKAQREDHLRLCPGCDQVKPAEEFRKPGRTCKACLSIKGSDARRKRVAAMDTTTDEGLLAYLREKRTELRKKYGLTPEEAFVYYVRRVCEVCGKPPTPPRKINDLDHDHATGKVRGLLCSHHNRVLGFLDEEPAVIQGLIDYLERYRDSISG